MDLARLRPNPRRLGVNQYRAGEFYALESPGREYAVYGKGKDRWNFLMDLPAGRWRLSARSRRASD